MTYELWHKNLTEEHKKGYKIMYPNMSFKQIYSRMISRFGLILKPPLILTKEQINLFKKSPRMNPITKRKIKKNTKTYLKIKEAYERSI